MQVSAHSTHADPAELATALTHPWVHGTHVDASEIVLSEKLCLDNETLCSFDLSRATLRGGVSAYDAVFRGMSWLRGTQIDQTCDLSGSIFRNDLRLDGLKCDTLRLSGCRFEGVVSLDGAQIDRLYLNDCVCLANLSLARAEVRAVCQLDRSVVMGGVWHAGARLAGLSMISFDVEGRQPRFAGTSNLRCERS